MNLSQISVFLENKPGTLNEMTEVLAKAGIDMRAMTLAEASDFGIARIIVEDNYNTVVALRDAGYVCTNTPVVGVAIPDEPGGLNNVLNILSEAKINIEYMYAFMGHRDAGHAYMIFRVTDPSLASKVLKEKGIRIIKQENICNL